MATNMGKGLKQGSAQQAGMVKHNDTRAALGWGLSGPSVLPYAFITRFSYLVLKSFEKFGNKSNKSSQ